MRMSLLFVILLFAQISFSQTKNQDKYDFSFDQVAKKSSVAQDVLISFESQDTRPRTSREEVCQAIYAGLNIAQTTNVNCVHRIPKVFVDTNIENEIRSGAYQSYFDVLEKNHEITVRIRLLKKDAEEDDQYRFVFVQDADGLWLNDIYNLAKNFMMFQVNKKEFRKDLLINLVKLDSKKLKVDENGQFIDVLTGKIVDSDSAYIVYRTETDLNFKKMRLAYEFSGYMAFITWRYLRNKANKVDWDYDLQTGLKGKFVTGSAIRFDDNARDTNIGHTYAGVLDYSLCRSNGLMPHEALVCTMFAALAWEFGTEYREVLSINDVITTGVAGSIVGEVAHRSSVAIIQKMNNPLGRILGGLMDPFGEMNRWHDRNQTPDADLDDSEVAMSFGHGERDGSEFTRFQGDVTVVDLPIREGQKVKAFIPGIYSSDLHWRMDRAQGKSDTLQFITKLAYGAIYKQNLKLDEKNRLNGYQLILSSASSYEEMYRHYDNEDFFAAVNVIGPRAQVIGFAKGVKLNLTLEFYGDFVLVHSYALEDFKSENELQGLLTTVREEGYYYGLGTTGRIDASVESNFLAAGMRGQQSNWNSIRTRDRFQDQVTRNVEYKDSVRSVEFYVQYRPTKKIALELSHETLKREGTIEGGYSGNKTEKRIMGRVIYKF